MVARPADPAGLYRPHALAAVRVPFEDQRGKPTPATTLPIAWSSALWRSRIGRKPRYGASAARPPVNSIAVSMVRMARRRGRPGCRPWRTARHRSAQLPGSRPGHSRPAQSPFPARRLAWLSAASKTAKRAESPRTSASAGHTWCRYFVRGDPLLGVLAQLLGVQPGDRIGIMLSGVAAFPSPATGCCGPAASWCR